MTTNNTTKVSDNFEWDFNVRKEQVKNPHTNDDTPYYGIFREDDNRLLHISGKNYNIVQYPQVKKIVDDISTKGNFDEVKILTPKEGRVFMACLNGRVSNIGNSGDEIANNIAVMTSHDASYPLGIAMSPNRLFCNNQLNALRPKIGLKIRHTSQAQFHIDKMHEMLLQVDNIFDKTIEEYEMLAKEQVSMTQVKSVIESLYPKAYDKKQDDEVNNTITRHSNRAEMILEEFEGDWNYAKTRGTAWHLYNAIQGLNQHEWSRGESSDNKRLSEIDGSVQRYTRKVYESVKSEILV